MPISGDEETMNYYASIPIKKRKFPMFRPSPPLPHEQSSLPVKSLKYDLPSSLPHEQPSLPVKSVTKDLWKDKSPSVCQESSLLNAGVGTCSLGKSNTNKNLVLEIKKEVFTGTNVNLVRCNADVCSTTPQVSLNTLDSQEKVLLFADQKMAGVTKVDSAPNEAPAAQVNKEIVNDLQDSCIPELLRTPGTVQLLLGPKDPHVPASIVGQSIADFNQEPDKLYNTSLCLSINHDKCADGYKSGDVKSNVSSLLVHADRSNWDLNTTIDTWQGPTADVAAPEIVPLSLLKNSADINGVKPTISSTAVLGAVTDAEQQFLKETDSVSNFLVSSFSPSGQDRSEDSLHLGLSTFRPIINAECLSSLPHVKTEPYVETSKHDCLGDRCNTMGLSDFVDKELVERCSSKAVSSSVVNPDEIIEPRPIKSEPTQGIQETEAVSCVPVEKFILHHDNVSSVCPSGLLTYPVKLTSGDAPNEFKVSNCKEEVHLKTSPTHRICKMVEHVTTDIDYSSQSHGRNDLKAAKERSIGPENSTGHGPLNPRGDSEGSISGQNIMKTSADMLEEDSCPSDCKADKNDDIVCTCSDGSHDLSKDKKYEHYEHEVAEVSIGKRDEEKHIQNDSDGNISLSFDFPDNSNTSQAPYSSYGNIEDQGETSADHIKECVNPAQEITGRDSPLQETDRIIDKDGTFQETGRIINRDSSFQESSTIEESEAIKMAITITQNSTFDISGRTVVQMDRDPIELADRGINGSQSMETNISEIKNVYIEGSNEMGKVDSTILKTESSITVNDVANDSNSGVKRSRIINLRQASDVASPSLPRFVTDRSLVSTRRERYADEDEKVYQRRKRVECYDDGPRRFERVRFQTQPFRDSRISQIRGRGRGFRQRNEWDFDRDFDGDVCNGPVEYQVRRKHVSSVGNAEVEDEGYRIGLGMGRGGRKPTSDVLPSFYHPSSRRFPTGVEDTTGTRGVQTVRGFPGNVFPRRRNGENATDLAGFRHEEEFTRDFPDEYFNRPRPTYQRFDGRFAARGNKNLSGIQRRAGLPRIRSKSPVRFETHSSRPWLSPQRESPESLNELQELPHRSATAYRMEMRSPGSRCFPVEIVSRRRGSPSFVSRPNNFVDVESGRKDLPRSASPDGRSPSNRIIPMNNRRLNIADPQERAGSDECGDSIRSGRFLGVDRNGEERRKDTDRYRNRSFCPPFDAVDHGNLHINSEEGPRPVRFCTEDGSDFIERGNVRKRDFERRIKNRSGIANGMRNMDEEACFRLDKQVWRDHGFDDTSRIKRRY